MIKLKSHFKRLRSKRGFTIIEVLVASLIAGFTIAAAMQLLIDQNKQHLIQEGITGLQQSTRASADELVGKIRQAGYRLQPGITALYSWNSNPDTLAVVFMAEPLCTASLSQAMAQATSNIVCDDTNLDHFPQDTWYFIYDNVTDAGEYFLATNINPSGGDIHHGSPLSKPYPQGANIFKLDYYKYYINRADTLNPQLMLVKNGGTPVIYADGVTDLQFRYRLGNGLTEDTVAVDRFVREIQMTIIGRTQDKDLFVGNYRYDTLRTSAMVRNLAM